MKRVIWAVFVAAFLAGCATFTGDIPVDIDDSVRYISPGVADGVQDQLIVTTDVPEIQGLRVAGYRFEIRDTSGSLVWEEAETAEATAIQRFLRRGPTVVIPTSIIWEGVNSRGDLVAEGDYSYSIEVWDHRSNRGSVGPFTVTVDNTPPSVDPQAASLWFSPNGDGRQDTLVIDHRSISREDRWDVTILGAGGQEIADYSLTGSPEVFTWDGLTSSGSTAPDGVYSYTIAAIDRAGNRGSATLEGIILNTSVVPLELLRRETAFSPNGDGVKDEQLFTLVNRDRTPIRGYTLTIVDDRGNSYRTISGGAPLPPTIRFDGRGDNRRTIPDGRYFGRLVVEFVDGNAPQVLSDAFEIDTRAPSIALNADYLLFSPDGDGRKDVIQVRASSSDEGLWEGAIVAADGRIVRSLSWTGRATDFEWDGKDDRGVVAPDGSYRYRISSTDEAGNRTVREFSGIRIDNRPTPVRLEVSGYGLSPNGDGIRDTVGLSILAGIRDEVEAWRLELVDSSGRVARTFTGAAGASLPESLVWDGRNAQRAVVEGEYVLRATVEYMKGNLATAELPRRIVVDVTGPRIELSFSGVPFSPDDDGMNDVLTITPRITDVSGVATWSATIIDPAQNEFFSFRGNGMPGLIRWNGHSSTGELVQSADLYTVSFIAIDELGNRGAAESVFPTDILVIKEGDRLRINISSIYFKPFTADYLDVERETRERNLQTLDRLAEILGRYPEHQIRLEGHAVRLLWDQPNRWPVEESNTLAPLSLARATAIRDALVQRGIRPSRMTTQGLGGTRPVVPHGDTENRWKNRRVEFILLR